ncbi:amino acid ABC transporter substrate-binding protein [Thauera humireducens]|uniref:amino acid ABC transporter substrate-binding protein n=1 Tax=Thauera humireducens TaxID=1134435 RepID=UPI00311FD2AD
MGCDIDLAKEAAKRLGAEVEFKPIDWSAKEAELNGKRVDALWNGLTISEERKKNIGFTTAYMENHQIIVVPANSAVKTKADLAGKVIGIQDGSSAIDAVQKDPVATSFKELKKFGDNVTALMDLTTGRLDAVVLDEVVGRYYTAKKPGEYVVLDDHFGTEEYGVGTRNDDTELLAEAAEGDGRHEGRRQRRTHLDRVVRQGHHLVSRPGTVQAGPTRHACTPRTLYGARHAPHFCRRRDRPAALATGLSAPPASRPARPARVRSWTTSSASSARSPRAR